MALTKNQVSVLSTLYDTPKYLLLVANQQEDTYVTKPDPVVLCLSLLSNKYKEKRDYEAS